MLPNWCNAPELVHCCAQLRAVFLVGLAAWNLGVTPSRSFSSMSHAIPKATFHALNGGVAIPTF